MNSKEKKKKKKKKILVGVKVSRWHSTLSFTVLQLISLKGGR